ncbi:DUF4328 domain-containing protein [Streptomyces sp. NBC_01278]|uniref:DUF4328 domain-containing protein n=1 Tax=Streptomyces sp. NBC_01278 TaxID=2903809 RepID=UPI002E354385|nr:DUF4328 domain-containing protein [Streptomyces sp. NBC_01278]
MGVWALLAAVAASDVFAVYVGIRTRAGVDGGEGFAFASEEHLSEIDRLFQVSDQLHAVALLACAAVFITWFHRARRAAGAQAPGRFGKGPGWSIGAWFLPFACLWLPYRIAVDMWSEGLRQSPAGAGGNGSFLPVNLWWGSFVGSVLLQQYATLRYRSAADLDALLDAVTLGMTADALNIAAAAAAAHFAIRLTHMQARRP